MFYRIATASVRPLAVSAMWASIVWSGQAEEVDYAARELLSTDSELIYASPLSFYANEQAEEQHRLDTLWSSGEQSFASDFPFAPRVAYRLRVSPWSDPDRLLEARLLEGTGIRLQGATEFASGRRLELAGAVQQQDQLLIDGESRDFDLTSIPVEVRVELSDKVDALAAVELSEGRYAGEGSVARANEQAAQAGIGIEVAPNLYAEALVGARRSALLSQGSVYDVELDAGLAYRASPGAQYTLTFNRSTNASLLLDETIESETIAFSGDFTLSDVWSSYFGVSQSWHEGEQVTNEEILTSEIAVEFTPWQSVSFSGGYIYQSGSLRAIDENDSEDILRFSASFLY